MTVMLNKQSQMVFFEKVFSTEWTNVYIAPLLEAGVIINIGFTCIVFEFEFNGSKQKFMLNLPCNTSALMKASCQPVVQDHAKKLIADHINVLLHKTEQGGFKVKKTQIDDVIKEVLVKPMFIGGALGQFDNLYTLPSGGGGGGIASNIVGVGTGVDGQTIYAQPKPKKEYKNGVIQLRDATAIGQKVKGTSAGSVYVVIAINPRVKLAARVFDDKLSIRAEFDGVLPKERTALKNIGMTESSVEHWSMHLGLGDCPPGRALGALLLDLDIKFDSQIQNIKEIL
jgi:hypothetical protein